jgi:hypothetical protein
VQREEEKDIENGKRSRGSALWRASEEATAKKEAR